MACANDTYAAENGSTSCTPCPAGTGTTGPASVNISECVPQCEAGFAGAVNGIEPCVECVNGTYSDSARSRVCSPCDDGETSGPGAVGCTACAEGEFAQSLVSYSSFSSSSSSSSYPFPLVLQVAIGSF
jgi:hypothetical protein